MIAEKDGKGFIIRLSPEEFYELRVDLASVEQWENPVAFHLWSVMNAVSQQMPCTQFDDIRDKWVLIHEKFMDEKRKA